MSNYYEINQYDIANGPGLRVTIFFTGCEHYCKNCFNQELWDFNEHITGLSILGGEPLNPYNIMSLSDLIMWFKEDFPNKNIWLWTGYTWEELMDRCDSSKEEDLNWILFEINVLVDGRFIEEQKDLTLKWRGSRNQRVIDVQKTLKEGKVILYEKAY